MEININVEVRAGERYKRDAQKQVLATCTRAFIAKKKNYFSAYIVRFINGRSVCLDYRDIAYILALAIRKKETSL